MKIAVIHDWLVTNAGAEKVLQAILEVYPNANIYSLVNFLKEEEKEKILAHRKVKTSFIQKLPFARKYFRNYLALFPKAIESLDLKEYDLLISSSWAVSKGIKKSNRQIHICYCHTPIRYAWDLYEEYTSFLKQPKKFLVQKTLKYIRKWDINSLNRVDYFIANSKFVSKRIKKTYGRESKVIYPPVDTKTFTFCNKDNKEDDFYLTASRLVQYKKIKLIVEAFNQMSDKKLIVIGQGEEYESIKKIAKKNIVLMGYQEEEILKEYMQKAKAFVYAAIEDFGIVPIEAMSCGTPVIALHDGGTAETVIDELTGIHFFKQEIEDIIFAVNKFEKIKFDREKISKFVEKYDKKRFKKELEEFILSRLKTVKSKKSYENR